MEETIKKAIKKLAERSDTGDSNDSMKFSQSALNLAHVLATLNAVERNQ